MLNRIRFLVLILIGATLPLEAAGFEPFGYRVVSHNKIVVAILVAFVAMQWAVTRRPFPTDSKRIWMLFFGFSVGIGALQSYVVGVYPFAIFDVTQTSLSLILFYFVMVYALTSEKDVDVLLAAFIVGCLLIAASGLLGFGRAEETKYGTRLEGEGGSSNLLTFNLLIAIPLALSFFFTTRRRLVRVLAPGSIVAMTVGIILSLTRTAYAAYPAMVLFFAVRFRRGSFLKYAIPAMALLVLPVLFAPQGAVKRFEDLARARRYEDLDRSAQIRLMMLPNMVEAISQNPVTGVGLGGYRKWAGDRSYRNNVIHNAYLQVLVEQGVVGFVPFMAIVVLSWLQISRAVSLASRSRVRDPELELVGTRAFFVQVAFVPVLIMGLMQPSNRHKGFWLLFALSTVMLALVRKRLAELAPASERHPWRAAPAPSPSTPAIQPRAG